MSGTTHAGWCLPLLHADGWDSGRDASVGPYWSRGRLGGVGVQPWMVEALGDSWVASFHQRRKAYRSQNAEPSSLLRFGDGAS